MKWGGTMRGYFETYKTELLEDVIQIETPVRDPKNTIVEEVMD